MGGHGKPPEETRLEIQGAQAPLVRQYDWKRGDRHEERLAAAGGPFLSELAPEAVVVPDGQRHGLRGGVLHRLRVDPAGHYAGKGAGLRPGGAHPHRGVLHRGDGLAFHGIPVQRGEPVRPRPRRGLLRRGREPDLRVRGLRGAHPRRELLRPERGPGVPAGGDRGAPARRGLLQQHRGADLRGRGDRPRP